MFFHTYKTLAMQKQPQKIHIQANTIIDQQSQLPKRTAKPAFFPNLPTSSSTAQHNAESISLQAVAQYCYRLLPNSLARMPAHPTDSPAQKQLSPMDASSNSSSPGPKAIKAHAACKPSNPTPPTVALARDPHSLHGW